LTSTPWRVPLSDLNFDEREERAVAEAVRSRWLTMGPRTEEFESRMAAQLEVRHAIAVANCTVALEIAYTMAVLRFSSMNPDASTSPLIIVPDITFVATANAASWAAAIPVLTDIADGDTPFLSLEKTRTVLEQHGSNAAAIAIMHYAGFDSDSEGFKQLADDNNLMLIEDAAHAVGGTAASGLPLGSIGDVGCFSFFSNKNMATGEGGLITTNDDDLAATMRLMRSHGMNSQTYDRHRSQGVGYDVLLPGRNARCSELVAALGLVQLDKLAEGNESRRSLTRLYRDHLQQTDRVRVCFADDELIDQGACHILSLLCESGELRDKIRETLTGNQIQTSHHYAPIHTFSAYMDSPRASSELPDATAFADRQITLPLYPALKEQTVEEICGRVLEACQLA
jgi:dTDP-4-amino-4,6-dideoxygalactose transaminase